MKNIVFRHGIMSLHARLYKKKYIYIYIYIYCIILCMQSAEYAISIIQQCIRAETLLNLFQVVQTLYIIPEAQQDYDTAMLIQ